MRTLLRLSLCTALLTLSAALLAKTPDPPAAKPAAGAAKPAEPKATQEPAPRETGAAPHLHQALEAGALTAEEADQLLAQRTALLKLAEAFKTDGKVATADQTQLREQMTAISTALFAEKHNQHGAPGAAWRFGGSVDLKAAFVQRLQAQDFLRAEARAYCRDFARLLELQQLLATDRAPADQRSPLQDEYDNLLTRYFFTR